VPDVTGQSQASAETAIVAVDLVVGTVDTEFSEVEAGLVISQDPAGGTLVPRDSEVNLLVSLGPALDCSQHDGNEAACRADHSCRWHKKTRTCRNR
jgi:beta-lactam-binding protein with PASTA domain